MEKCYDLIIIGAGPAGMTAGIYASRAQLDYLILERSFAGGQIINTYEVENYTGYKSLSGIELAQKMQEHLEYLGGKITNAEVTEIKLLEDGTKKVITPEGEYHTKTILIATGANSRKLGVKGEDQYSGRGVSYCATCDGAFYRDKTTIVVGGGDVAVEDAIYLARVCKKVYIAHRRDEFRAVKNLQTKLMALPNVEILWFTEVDAILGDTFVHSVELRQNQTGQKRILEVDGVFIAVGTVPNTGFLGDLVALDSQGNIITDEKNKTSVDGIYAAGDLRSNSVRQIIAACADAVVAIMEIDKLI